MPYIGRFNQYNLLMSNYNSMFVRVQIKKGNKLLLLRGLFLFLALMAFKLVAL